MLLSLKCLLFLLHSSYLSIFPSRSLIPRLTNSDVLGAVFVNMCLCRYLWRRTNRIDVHFLTRRPTLDVLCSGISTIEDRMSLRAGCLVSIGKTHGIEHTSTADYSSYSCTAWSSDESVLLISVSVV